MEERLKLFLAMEGLSPSQFADKLGVQRSGVSHLLSGRNKPSFEFISRMLATYPRLNPDWLIMGTGKAYRDMPGAEIAGQAGTDTEFDRAPEAPLQENSVTNDTADLFSIGQQSVVTNGPAPLPPEEPQPAQPQPAAQSFKPQPFKPAVPSRVAPEGPAKQPPLAPAPGKRIAQITILYTDGSYEIR